MPPEAGPTASAEADEKSTATKKLSAGNSDEPSAVRAALSEARQDLWRAQPVLFPGLFNALRDFVFDPALAISSVLIPPLLGLTADNALAKCFTLIAMPIKHVYGYIPRDEDSDRSMRAVSRSVVLHPGAQAQGRMPKFRPPSDLRSAFLGSVSFMVGAASDVVGVATNPKKMKRWVDALGQLKAYLNASGVGDELEEAIMKPMLRGRLFCNLKILNDIQEVKNADRAEKAKCCSVRDIEDDIREGHRLMRFATAAYGTTMIKSAIDKDVGENELCDETSAIATHTGVDPADVRLLYRKDDGDQLILHHFAAVDHKSKSIVLALRGTLSLSGAIVDVQGMASNFCCGLAHQGMAEMADTIWNTSGEDLKKIFAEPDLKEYGLTIIGHSLGAGTACLLNIKCHIDKLVGDRSIKCYAFAPPPTFNPCKDVEPNDDLVDEAMKNCVAFIHDNDAVPFLSVASVRRLASLLDAVDNVTENMWFFKRWKIFHEWDEIPQNVFESFDNAIKHGTKDIDAAREVDGCCEVFIPARVIVWMKKNLTNKHFSAIGCDSTRVTSDNTVFISPDMFTDHLPEQYEDALDDLLEQQEGQKND
mmetsp:Transcript_53417/g.159861  ORF Transcript_53417/g.159861 Transcript_53417/m.159861 type:complete len:591 (-) Transcript_53417:233-2005(-)|eukprot:CAMPEP_0113545474 /NCGR_PEP_ID=MMETSP0015_2-20120614/11279_1 /TAXON_ID=2838 /ORGANISM="Odontella" /LENGTH=590 /DNA_ID=CAMNT_0000445839 /DNA_START=262 /DNA_END=2034 /DNA_ORIENTATION=- /assembly_acc=CAM_ASM_000160